MGFMDMFRKPKVKEEPLIKSEPKYTEPIALLNDPFFVMNASGYKEKYTSLSYEILRRVASRDSVIGSIILTRINQVSTFTRPSRTSSTGVGFSIKCKNPKKTLTPEEEATMLSIETFIEQMGYTKSSDRDSFTEFVKKILRDSLTYDQACFEIVPDVYGKPAEIIAVDGATIRVVDKEKNLPSYPMHQSRDDGEVSYVQVIDGEVRATFSSNELAFCIRNPRTDIRLSPYGFSEIEQVITQITSHLYAEEYNGRYFSQGGTTKGIINLKTSPAGKDSGIQGTIQNNQLESFRAQWNSQVAGLTGAWKTPVLQVPNGIEYINVSQSNREMEFEKWMNYLVNICCSIFQIDPAEVNFPNNGGVGGTSGGLFQGGVEDKLQNSKDKGLRPLLRFIEDIINKHIVDRFSDDYVFTFDGLDPENETEKLENIVKQVHNFKTLNEVREEYGLPPIEGGHLILDSSYINYISSKEYQAQEQEQGEEEGYEDEDYDDEDIGDEEYLDADEDEEVAEE